MRFKDKVALVTAAANGIGRSTAQMMAREGATVIGVDNNAEALTAAMEAITAEGGGRAIAKPIDALDEGQVNEVVAWTKAEHGRVDILVNAVGGSTIVKKPNAHVDELGFEDWLRLIAFNLNSTFLFCHAVSAIMKAQGGGKIVNLTSRAGHGMGKDASSGYCAAKGGIIAFTRKLSFELGPFGININAIAPSTTLTERIRPRWDAKTPEEQAADLELIPLRRLAVAEDHAKVICFLASSDADFVTGLTIDVTGGVV